MKSASIESLTLLIQWASDDVQCGVILAIDVAFDERGQLLLLGVALDVGHLGVRIL